MDRRALAGAVIRLEMCAAWRQSLRCFFCRSVKGWFGQGLVRGLRIQPADYGAALVNHGFMAWFVAAV
jgi:hypothetical protein